MTVVQQPVTIAFSQRSVIKPEPKDSSECNSSEIFGVRDNDKFKCLEFHPAAAGHYYAKFTTYQEGGQEMSAPVEEGYLWPAHLDLDMIPARARLRKGVDGSWFKSRNASSNELADAEKIWLSAGSEISVKSVGDKVEKEHLKVTLFEAIGGLIEGFLWVGNTKKPGHWDIAGWEHPAPKYVLGNDLASKIIKYSLLKGYKIWDKPNELNIVYVEGMNTNGTLNSDAPNQWNDIRTVIEFVETAEGKKPKFCFGPVKATTEPGNTYTYRKLNPNGAFRIKFGQYIEAWQMGFHNWKPSHPALVQVGRLCGHRDLNKDFSRSGDKVFCGSDFGVNQHHGGNAGVVGPWSAGCLVGQSVGQHNEFMRVLKLDTRYKANRKFRYSTTVIPGDDLLAKTKD